MGLVYDVKQIAASALSIWRGQALYLCRLCSGALAPSYAMLGGLAIALLIAAGLLVAVLRVAGL